MKKSILVLALFIISNSLFSQSLKKTQVLILGTPHLEQLNNFQTPYLKKVLDTLQAKQFDVVAIENMPTELLFDIKSRKEAHWQDLYKSFSKFVEFGQAHQKSLDISFEVAQRKINELLLKTTLSDADRIEYINSYICIYDIWSATLHYKLLAEKSKLSKTVIDLLEKLSNAKNEINTIALEIAEKSKLNQIYYIDNLQDETILVNEFPKFMSEYQSNANSVNELLNNLNFYQKFTSLENEAINKKDLYLLYKFYNSNEYMTKDFEGQWALWFKTNFNSKTDRSRYSLWEMRNLSITANILRVIASNPEKKIIVIIGASHKSFLEKYLKQIQDIELLEF